MLTLRLPRIRTHIASRHALAAALLAAAAGAAHAQQPAATAAAPVLKYAQTWDAREIFYTTSQGSHMMPFAYFKALRQDNGEPFAADQLARYGYLRNDNPNNTNDLPVGFVVDGNSGQLGMTCAACHTGQIEYQKDGVSYALRIDGAPAHADFQQFLADLTKAARGTLNDAQRFDTFAKDALGTRYSTGAAALLKQDFAKWVDQFGAFMDNSLPDQPWGPGRLDAFGMIFNRVAGRDLGIDGNFRKADAPVSYPFLWNASRQDHTQWNGGVPNGLFIQALGRNTGEVFGVFADFMPRRNLVPVPPIDFSANSADFAGLQTLEELITTLPSPKWPEDISPIDRQLAAKGQPLFKAKCAGCHEEKLTKDGRWVTPVMSVETDAKVATNAGRSVNPGVFIGTPLPPEPGRIGVFTRSNAAADVLAASVVGSIGQEAADSLLQGRAAQSGVWRAIFKDGNDLFPDGAVDVTKINPATIPAVLTRINARLSSLFTPTATQPSYESRVLYGIWATAPYLHNGSVANLWELLLPAKQRKSTFKVGSSKFDWKNVGYVTDETPFGNGMFTADPNNQNGNGNGGHEYGTDMSEADRWALIEYLKTL